MPPDKAIKPEAAPTFQVGHIRSGDVVFVYPRTSGLKDRIFRNVNVMGQRLLGAMRRQRRVPLLTRVRAYSHVMLGLDGGLVIHADGKRVNIEVVSDALRFASAEESVFEIYRRRDMPQDLGEKIARAAARYHYQQYRFSPYFWSAYDAPAAPGATEDYTQFCSRLVAHAYRAAGIGLGPGPDSKVLPLDLYRLCQSEEWANISAEFVQAPISAAVEKAVGPIDIPGKMPVLFSEFVAGMDDAIRESAGHAKQQRELEYSVITHMLYVEGLLAQKCDLDFKIVNALRIAPAGLNGDYAARVVFMLQNLDSVLATSLIATVEAFVADSILNKSDGQPGTGAYAGLPSALAIREMQLAREAKSIYTALLLAEIGLLSVLGQLTGHEKLEPFRSVSKDYVRDFSAAVHAVDNLSMYEDAERLFRWVDSENQRARCRKLVKNIIGALEMIEMIRKSARTQQHDQGGN